MKFSLLVPTRSRVMELQRLLQSITNTVSDKSQIEILIASDFDDEAFKAHLDHVFLPFADLNIKHFTREHSDFINRDYYNWLAEKATGKYLFVSADDLVYLVPNWDVIIEQHIESYFSDKRDRIGCFGIKDNTPKPSHHLPPFPCFPLVTREAYQYFQFVLHPFVPTWGADYLCYLLYTGINRYHVIADQTYINHISYHTKQAEVDPTNERIGDTFNRLKMRPEYNIDLHAETTIPKQIAEAAAYLNRLYQGS